MLKPEALSLSLAHRSGAVYTFKQELRVGRFFHTGAVTVRALMMKQVDQRSAEQVLCRVAFPVKSARHSHGNERQAAIERAAMTRHAGGIRGSLPARIPLSPRCEYLRGPLNAAPSSHAKRPLELQ